MKGKKIIKNFIPLHSRLFDLLEQDVNILNNEAEIFLKIFICDDKQKKTHYIKTIKEFEIKGDEITNEILILIKKSRFTPFSKSSIKELTIAIDEVNDIINRCSLRIFLYKPKCLITEHFKMAQLINESVKLIHAAVVELKTDRNIKKIIELCAKINNFENQSDDLFHYMICQLFEKEKDPIELIKQKEILEILEKATDKTKDVADIIYTMVY